MEEALVVATWALVFVTLVLALATVVLGVFAFLQWRAGEKQSRLASDGLDVSRRLLEQAQQERAAAAPLDLGTSIKDGSPGRATIYVWNASADVVMRLRRVEIVEQPTGLVVSEEELAEGTLGRGEEWTLRPFTWDASRAGLVLAVKMTGHRIGGPEMTIENRFRVQPDGTLSDL
jgi:hypothetical protein